MKSRSETGGTASAARLKSNKESLRDEDSPVNTYGTHELRAWRVAPGQFWFQTTRSDFARKLAKRADARRVEISGHDHYRRTFQIRATRRKVERIIERYLASAGDQFSEALKAQDRAKILPRVSIAGASVREVLRGSGIR